MRDARQNLNAMLNIAVLRQDLEDVYHLTDSERNLIDSLHTPHDLLAIPDLLDRLDLAQKEVGFYHVTWHEMPGYASHGTGLHTVYYKWDRYGALLPTIHQAYHRLEQLKQAHTWLSVDQYARMLLRGLRPPVFYVIDYENTPRIFENRSHANDFVAGLEANDYAIYAVDAKDLHPTYQVLEPLKGDAPVPYHPAFARLFDTN